MDLWSENWFPEMDMDDSALIHELQHTSSLDNSVDSFTFESFPPSNEVIDQSSTLQCAAQVSENGFETPPPITQQVTEKPWTSCASEKASSSSAPTIISFANSDSTTTPPTGNDYYGNAKFYGKPDQIGVISLENMSSSSISQLALENAYDSLEFGDGGKKGITRTPAQAQDHVLAERKRRERMTQRFIALSAVIPGLKKLDKANVLADAINYIKELQDRVKKLEEEGKRNNNDETIVGAKRPRVSGSDEANSSSDENNFDSSSEQLLPEIEVKVSEGNVLVRVHCKQQPGIIKEILGQMERHHLTMVSSSIMPFGEKVHITIIAQIADQSHMTTTKELVDDLRTAIQTLI